MLGEPSHRLRLLSYVRGRKEHVGQASAWISLCFLTRAATWPFPDFAVLCFSTIINGAFYPLSNTSPIFLHFLSPAIVSQQSEREQYKQHVAWQFNNIFFISPDCNHKSVKITDFISTPWDGRTTTKQKCWMRLCRKEISVVRNEKWCSHNGNLDFESLTTKDTSITWYSPL